MFYPDQEVLGNLTGLTSVPADPVAKSERSFTPTNGLSSFLLDTAELPELGVSSTVMGLLHAHGQCWLALSLGAVHGRHGVLPRRAARDPGCDD